jgi:hypothetical protein
MTYKPYIAAAVLLLTCLMATYGAVERFSTPLPSVLLHDYVPGTQHPEAWGPTSARERLNLAAKTQTARYPSWVP